MSPTSRAIAGGDLVGDRALDAGVRAPNPVHALVERQLGVRDRARNGAEAPAIGDAAARTVGTEPAAAPTTPALFVTRIEGARHQAPLGRLRNGVVDEGSVPPMRSTKSPRASIRSASSPTSASQRSSAASSCSSATVGMRVVLARRAARPAATGG